MKKITIIATGGTIAGKGEAGKTHGYKPGELDISGMLDGIYGIHELAEISGVQLLNTASDNITGENLLTLAKQINQLASETQTDGFVITHGTDTLEETAYFLNLTCKTNKPIVITGAMRPATATSADGPQNLYQAVALAANPSAWGKGVLVVFSDGIYAAREVTKISTFRTDGFSGRDFGCIGYMRDNVAEFVSSPAKQHTYNSCFDIENCEALPKVGVAYFHLDADPQIPKMILESSQGMVIAGAGNGGFSTPWRDALFATGHENTPIIVSSRISNGLVTKHPHLPENCVGSGTLNPQKARILLQLALTITSDIAEIRKIFAEY